MSTPSPAPVLLPARLNVIVPANVRYDGPQLSPSGPADCFTDLESGSSFALREADISSVGLARRVAALRRAFRPLPPVFQKAPSLFSAPEHNHY